MKLKQLNKSNIYLPGDRAFGWAELVLSSENEPDEPRTSFGISSVSWSIGSMESIGFASVSLSWSEDFSDSVFISPIVLSSFKSEVDFLNILLPSDWIVATAGWSLASVNLSCIGDAYNIMLKKNE